MSITKVKIETLISILEKKEKEGVSLKKIEELIKSQGIETEESESEEIIKELLEKNTIEEILELINIPKDEIKKIVEKIKNQETEQSNDLFYQIDLDRHEIKKEDGKLYIELDSAKYEYAEDLGKGKIIPLVEEWKVKNINFIKDIKEELEKLENKLKTLQASNATQSEIISVKRKIKKIKDNFEEGYFKLSNKNLIKEYKENMETMKKNNTKKTSLHSKLKRSIDNTKTKIIEASKNVSGAIQNPENSVDNAFKKGIEKVTKKVPGVGTISKMAATKNMFK